MRYLKHAAFLLVSTVVGAGCASTARGRDASAMNSLSVGMSKAQVIAALGNPTSSSASGNGTECLDYMFFRVGQERQSWNEEDHFVVLKNGKVSSYGQNDCEWITKKGRLEN